MTGGRAAPTGALLAGVLGGVLALGGCGGGGLGKSGPTLSPEDFAAPSGAQPATQHTAAARDESSGEPARPGEPDPGPTPVASDAPSRTPPAARGTSRGPRLISTPGEPVRSTTNADAVEAPVLVNAKVGDINGRPIYADEFLEPMADRLRAEAAQKSPSEWRTSARMNIRRQLELLLSDELMRAEAIASLTPEQKQGLRAFLQGFRDVKVRESRGSSALAERRALEDTGKSLDQTLKEEEEVTLIRLTFAQEINKRVNVSWRDIVLRYEQDDEKYRPPPTARFRLIRVRTDDAQAVALIGASLEGGDAFESVASRPENTWHSDDGGLHEAVYEGEYTEAEFFGADALNEKARTLHAGEWTGPFELGTSTCWLKLDGIERQEIDLYEAQLGIYEELLAERRSSEWRRYINRLVDRARVTDLDAIQDRLVEIAAQRYGPKG